MGEYFLKGLGTFYEIYKDAKKLWEECREEFNKARCFHEEISETDIDAKNEWLEKYKESKEQVIEKSKFAGKIVTRLKIITVCIFIKICIFVIKIKYYAKVAVSFVGIRIVRFISFLLIRTILPLSILFVAAFYTNMHNENLATLTDLSEQPTRLSEQSTMVSEQLIMALAKLTKRFDEHDDKIEKRLGEHNNEIEDRFRKHNDEIEKRLGEHNDKWIGKLDKHNDESDKWKERVEKELKSHNKKSRE